MTPERPVAPTAPVANAVPPVASAVAPFATLRYAGSRAPYTLLWREVGRDGSLRTYETVADPALAVSVVAAMAATKVTQPRTPAAELTDLQHLHARLSRELRRADAVGVDPCPHPHDPMTAADLDTIAALLQAQGQLDNEATDHRRAAARRAELVDVLTRWLDTVPITPRTVDDPVEPLHGTRCALASAARSLLTQILTTHGVPAPERM